MIHGSTFTNGERTVFTTQFEDHADRNGHCCEIVRPLPSETGPMYRIRFDDGLEIAAFEYELQKDGQ